MQSLIETRATRRRVTRRAATAGATVLLGSLAAACAGQTGGTTSPSAKPARVAVRTFAAQAVVDLMQQKVLPGYKQKVPHHSVDWEQQSTGSGAEMIMAVTTATAGGTAPDVFHLGSDWNAQVARAKLIKDLTGYVKTWGQDKDYYPNAVAPIWGRRWFLPITSGCDLYLYRMDWFREANLPVEPARFPVTWEAFADAAAKLTRRQGDEFTRAGFYTTGEAREWRQLLWQAGGEEWNADHSKAAYNSPAGVEALAYLRDLIARHQVVRAGGMQIPPGQSAYSAGLTAMQRANPSAANTVKSRAPEVFAQTGFGAPHKHARQVNQIDVDGWVMAATSREPDAAFSLMTFVQEPATLLTWNEATGYFPPRKSLASSAYMQQPHMKVFGEMLDKYGRMYHQYQTPILNTAAADVMANRKTPKQALDDAARENDIFIAQLQPAPK